MVRIFLLPSGKRGLTSLDFMMHGYQKEAWISILKSLSIQVIMMIYREFDVTFIQTYRYAVD